MNTNLSPLDAWLTGEHSGSDVGQLFWDPGFDAERRVVVSRLGPYYRLFERPQDFIPHFFHRVYSLPIDDWQLTTQTRLYGGFCTVTAELQIHFQATLKFVERNRDGETPTPCEILPNLRNLRDKTPPVFQKRS